MDISHKVAWLLHLYDMKMLGVDLPFPSQLKETKFLESTIEKYRSSFQSRITNAALRLTFMQYKKYPKTSTTNSEPTYVDFESKYLPTLEGFGEFQKNVLEVSQKLLKDIPARTYIEFLNQS